MTPVIKGLSALAGNEGFVALEMDCESRRFCLSCFTADGSRISSIKVPISSSRKMMVSGDNQMVLLLAQDSLLAVSLQTDSVRSWKFLEAESLFAASTGVVAQSDDGSVVLISSGLEMTPLGKRSEIAALFFDLGVSVERLLPSSWRYTRTGAFDVVHNATGKYVLASLCVDHLLWLSESGAALRAFDIEQGRQVFEMRPKPGWHFDLLSPTLNPSEMIAAAINFETGSHLEIFSLTWKDGLLSCTSQTQLPISPPHCAFVRDGTRFVSGTREIFDSMSGRLVAQF